MSNTHGEWLDRIRGHGKMGEMILKRADNSDYIFEDVEEPVQYSVLSPDCIEDIAEAVSAKMGIGISLEPQGKLERKKGTWQDEKGNPVEWVKIGDDWFPKGWCCCSVCGQYLVASDEYPVFGYFCPKCGSYNGGGNEMLILKRADNSDYKMIKSVEEPERKKGKWIQDGYSDYKVVCDQCGEPCASYIMEKPRDRFCKWCGAYMGEEDEEL